MSLCLIGRFFSTLHLSSPFDAHKQYNLLSFIRSCFEITETSSTKVANDNETYVLSLFKEKEDEDDNGNTNDDEGETKMVMMKMRMIMMVRPRLWW